MVVMAVLPPSLGCRELFTGRETLRLLCRPTTVTDSRAAATASAVALAAAAFDWFALAATLGAAALPANRAVCALESARDCGWRAQGTALESAGTV